MTMILVWIAAVMVAAICIECVRNEDYEDGLIGRLALWALACCGVARAIQIVDVMLAPWLGGTLTQRGLGLDNVEVMLWFGLLLFFGRHYYRFRKKCLAGGLEWHQAQKT